MKVCLAPTHLLWNEKLGGHAWVFLNWALGLQEQGCQVILLEKLRFTDDPETLVRRLETFHGTASRLGLEALVALFDPEAASVARRDLPAEFHRLTIPVEQAVEESALLLNFRYSTGTEIISRFRRTALVDIDPGLLQLWMSGGHLRVAPHDLYFTIGETVGRPGARFPDCGIEWHYVPPPVHLPSWPVMPAPPAAPYSTVTNWWGEYELLDGEMVNNEKRTAFMAFLDLPKRTRAKLELAIYLESGRLLDEHELVRHGWSARPASEVSSSPEDYRRYIQNSRGEFSCAKRSCLHFQNAWISDRTICYLASGRPAVVEFTGESGFLPASSGLFRFRDVEEAAAQLDEIERDHARHATLARALAEEHFDASKVLARVLDRALASGSTDRA